MGNWFSHKTKNASPSTITRLFTVLKSGASLPITINIKTSSKTGFTPVCYSFDDYNIFLCHCNQLSDKWQERNAILYFPNRLISFAYDISVFPHTFSHPYALKKFLHHLLSQIPCIPWKHLNETVLSRIH